MAFKILYTRTVSEFKAETGYQKISVKTHTQTGKLFLFGDDIKIGVVHHNIVPYDSSISRVIDEQGNEMWILHETFKPDWKKFKKILEHYKIKRLYHFTDKRNLESIKQCDGLYSLAYCEKNKIPVEYASSKMSRERLDIGKGIENYVKLSFVREHPMKFVNGNQNKNMVILEINSDVIYLNTTKFTAQNAVKTGEEASGSLEKFKSIKFPILSQSYFDLDDYDKHYYQAEVLVWERVPLVKILNINTL